MTKKETKSNIYYIIVFILGWILGYVLRELVYK